MNDLVSIIMPNYNCEKFLDATIRCVIEQTYENWELIIVDDFSTDKSIGKIENYVKHDKRIKLIKNSCNKGAAYSRNIAISVARGRWIAFLDSDDIWNNNKLSDQLNYMIENDYHFSYTQYGEIDEENNELNVVVSGPNIITRKKMLRYCYVGCLTVMYDADYIGTIQIPNNTIKNNDYALWLKISKSSDCYLLKKNLASYRKRKGSISSGKKTKLIKYHYLMFKNSEGMNSFKAIYYTIGNLIFGILKKLFYVKHN